jgi:hypothetical protein
MKIDLRKFTMPLVTILSCLAAPLEASAAPGGRNSAATIMAAFADSCRAFVARSSKDISHVELHYADGRVVKDESIGAHDYAVDGDPGDELELAIVKSGTTSTLFDCATESHPPVARLEIATPAGRTIEACFDFFAGGLICEQSTPRAAWTSAEQVPDAGGSDSGLFHWGCGSLTDFSQCSFTITFRGVDSFDPDGDIATWSLDFGDGTSTGGGWDAAPPAQIAHEYAQDGCSNTCVVILTVTDATGQSASASMRMVFVDLTPD